MRNLKVFICGLLGGVLVYIIGFVPFDFKLIQNDPIVLESKDSISKVYKIGRHGTKVKFLLIKVVDIDLSPVTREWK